jgi:hypothetical protein
VVFPDPFGPAIIKTKGCPGTRPAPRLDQNDVRRRGPLLLGLLGLIGDAAVLGAIGTLINSVTTAEGEPV